MTVTERERKEKSWLTTFLKKNNLRYSNWNFKIIDTISYYTRHFCNISLWTGCLLSSQI